MEGLVAVDSSHVRDLINKEKVEVNARCEEAIQHHISKLNERNSEYVALEDEFRLALQIEANRYNELLSARDQLSIEMDTLRKSYEALSRKEAKSKHLITELTSMVKEQKTRISEIMNGKQEMQSQFKDRMVSLETEVTELRKLAVKTETLQQDKDRLTAHVRAQESIIQGLRSERKLWGQELAQQGASLSHDRGRMESQIKSQQEQMESQNSRIIELTDSVRIKTKLIEDQTETIKNMKMDLSKFSADSQKMYDELRHAKQDLEADLDAERVNSSELQVSF